MDEQSNSCNQQGIIGQRRKELRRHDGVEARLHGHMFTALRGDTWHSHDVARQPDERADNRTDKRAVRSSILGKLNTDGSNPTYPSELYEAVSRNEGF